MTTEQEAQALKKTLRKSGAQPSEDPANRQGRNLIDRATRIQGNLDGAGLRIAIVQARFNHSITDLLLEGALRGLRQHHVREDDAPVFVVPGSFELALVAQQVAQTGRHDAIICIGAIIRGETAHFDIIATQTATGIASVSRQTGVPILFCVLTTDTVEQALQRSGVQGENVGWSAALGAIEMANLRKKIGKADGAGKADDIGKRG